MSGLVSSVRCRLCFEVDVDVVTFLPRRIDGLIEKGCSVIASPGEANLIIEGFAIRVCSQQNGKL